MRVSNREMVLLCRVAVLVLCLLPGNGMKVNSLHQTRAHESTGVKSRSPPSDGLPSVKLSGTKRRLASSEAKKDSSSSGTKSKTVASTTTPMVSSKSTTATDKTGNLDDDEFLDGNSTLSQWDFKNMTDSSQQSTTTNTSASGKLHLPKERTQPESWAIGVSIVFFVSAGTLFAITSARRRGYQDIGSVSESQHLVV